MYGLLQTTQSPFQFVWCSSGLGQYSTGVGVNTIFHLAPTNNATGGVYVSANGSGSNNYTNQRGALTYSLNITGDHSTSKATAPPYSDSVGILSGTTYYALTITDGNSGQSYLYNNSITWSGI